MGLPVIHHCPIRDVSLQQDGLVSHLLQATLVLVLLEWYHENDIIFIPDQS